MSAAKAGISERTGLKIDKGKEQSGPKEHDWRTRSDPFAVVWAKELEPMLSATPALRAITLLEYLQTQYPGTYPDKCLRTLQRRVKGWRVTSAPEKVAIFRQTHPPGQQGLSDFTELKGVVITIAGEPLPHLVYHFRLACTGWRHLKVILGGERFTALAEGLQEALWRLGGALKAHRADSLSAAFKNLSQDEVADTTSRYAQFCATYQMKPTRNNRGESHENGSIECPHGSY